MESQGASFLLPPAPLQVKDSGQICLVLDYMDAGSLATVTQGGSMPEPLLAKVTATVLQGLAYLHRRHTIHRDIKPANILTNCM